MKGAAKTTTLMLGLAVSIRILVSALKSVGCCSNCLAAKLGRVEEYINLPKQNAYAKQAFSQFVPAQLRYRGYRR